jgi:beta-lactamase regulating signal transducer with metallopeptidase domain
VIPDLRERAFWLLVAAAASTYPAVAMACCVAGLLARGNIADVSPLVIATAILLIGVATIAVTNAVRTANLAVRDSRRFRRWAETRAIPIPSRLTGAINELGLTGRVRLVNSWDQFAVTVGLLRTYVVVSQGLAHALSGSELRAVLAHERAHARRRDPLRLVIGRVLTAHLWFLPAAHDMRVRAECGYELAADRHAVRRFGRPALASALLSITLPPPGSSAGAHFAGHDFLADRITQLESGQAPRPESIPLARSLSTAVAAAGFILATVGASAFMLLAGPCCPPGLLT